MTHQQAINLAHDLQRPFCLISYRDDGSILSVVPNHIHTLPEWVGFTRDQALRDFCEVLPCERKSL